MTNFKLNLKGQFNNSQTAVNPDSQPTVNRRSRLMSVLCLLTLLTIGVGQAWASHDFFTDGACGIKVNYDGSTVTEITKNKSGASTEALGTVTKLYLKGWWFAAWENTNDFSGSESGTLYYRVYPSGSASGSYSSSSRGYYNWGGWSGGSQNVWLGNDGLNVNLLSGLVGGNYIFEYYFMMGSSYLSNGGSNYKISFTYDPKYTVTVSAGSNGSVAKTSVTAGNIDAVTLPSATANTGYHFNNWTTSSSNLTLGNTTSATTGTVKARATGTVTANFAANTYTVAYNANDDNYPGTAAGATTSSSHTYGTAKNLTSNGFSRTGYIFAGWATTPTGDVAYSNGQSVTNLSSTQGATVTLYAKWTPIWQLYNNTTHIGDFEYISDYEYTLTITLSNSNAEQMHFKKDGTTFYYTGADNPTTTNNTLFSGDGMISYATMGLSNREYTLFIRSDDSGSSWYLRATSGATYSVTYNGNSSTSGSAPVDGSSPYEAGANVTVLGNTGNLSKTGYTFSGWNTQADGNGTNYAVGSTISSIDANKILYAKWTENMTTVTVNVNPLGAGTITVDASAFTPGNTTTAGVATSHSVVATANSGKVFLDWSTSGNATGTNTTNTFTLNGNGNGGNGTLTANFGVSTGWYMEGTDFGGWGGDNCSSLPTTYPFSRPYRDQANTYYIPVTLKSSSYFKVHYGDGCSNVYNFGSNSSDVTVSKNNVYNLTADASHSGTVSSTMSDVWVVLNTSTKKFWVQDPATYYTITIENGSSGNILSGTEGTITIKSNNLGNFDTKQFASGETIKLSVSAKSGYYIDDITIGGNSIASDVYTASYNGTATMPAGDATLTVSYKRIFTVTYGVGTGFTSMGAVSVSPATTSGSYVLAGTSITFTATPNLGYKFVGWYSDAGCNTQISTDNPYIVSVTAAKTVYAKFELMDIKINSDINGSWPTPWTQTIMTHSSGSPAIYTYSTTFLARATEDASAPYNSGYHFNFVDSNNELLYDYNGVQAPTSSGSSIDGVRKTDDGNSTIQFGLTRKSDITITLTLQAAPAKPTVNIAADPYYTITTAKGGSGAAGITISPASVEARSGANSAEITATIAPGYTFVNWTAGGTITINSPNATTTTIKATGAGTLTANATANSYTVHFDGNGNTGGSMTDIPACTYGVAFNLTANGFTKTGYSFAGWATTADGAVTYANGENVSNLTTENNGTATLYAKWSPVAYTVTLDGDEEHNKTAGTYALSGGTATFDAALPSLTGTLPTAADGYAFMGFYSEQNGNGVQVIDANGAWIATAAGYTSGGNWVHEGNTTLYAYFKKAEITAVELSASILDPVAAGGTGFITANPTIAPSPSGTTKVCWELLYDNNNPVEEHNAISTGNGEKTNEVKFSIAGLAAGGYKIKATLALGITCPATPADVLSEREVSFTIASGYTVTIQYKDASGNTIASSTTSPGKATDWTSVSAPEIFGYTFSTWVPGDGITLESPATTNSNQFKATFNGTLTAQYTKNKYIYLDLSQKFSGSGYWNNPWVYFYNGDPWDATNGTGATGHSHYISGHAMTQIGDSKIWYFDYGSVSNPSQYIAFTWDDKHGQDNFNYTDVIFRGDFTEGTPLFVPTVGQTMSEKNTAKYYNKGYWTNYVGDKTGYSVIIYDGSDNELKRQRFTSVNNDMRMTMKAALDLDAATTYKIEILRDNGKYYKKNSTLTSTNCTNLDFTENATKGSITSTAAGSYVFTLNYSPSTLNGTDFELRLTVEYPAAANDFQVLYNDNAEWSLGSTHSATWIHPSRVIRARAGGVDTISFFVAKGDGISAQLKARKVSSIDAGTGTITWESLNINEAESQSLTVDSAAVWNFKVTQGTTAGTIASIEKIGAYTGNYYIRCNALNSNWDNYTTDGDHRMTYSSFSESAANSFGEKFSHYKAKWCPRNTNIAFCIANDYSPCITDTLVQDVPDSYSNTESDGTLKYEKEGGNMKYNNDGNAYLDRYSANVRFMWNRKTNKISRAYVSAATSGLAQFLVLRAGQELHNDDNTVISSTPANSVLLHDNENWIYEAKLMIKPGTRFKLYACYAKSPVDPASAQYFRGAYDDNKFTSDENSVILIGGESVDYQLARIVYDFKTNRLIAAWMPSGEVDGDNAINADVMIIREHQESARCITFANSSANLSGVKTVYGVMKFNRWILNNRGGSADEDKTHARPDHIAEDLANYHAPLTIENQKSTYERRLYFISFPFDVRVGDIFGFGQYGSYWVLQYYDGLSRAKNGYWLDSRPNWKYISPTQVANGYTLKANEGYILELNLSAMAADNTSFWSNGISTIELYFPSTVAQETLKQTNCTIPALNDDYQCTINRGTAEGDRRVKDSYWRCIGVPSYNLYNSALKDGSGNTISWKTDYTWYNDEREFPFIYMWNKTDNTLTPQSTSTFLFQPMHAYLTQIKSDIVWTAVSAKPSSIVARRARKEANNEHEWRIELRQDTTFLDQTYVRMTNLEQVTDSFDFGQDLVKELNSRSNLYTYIGYEKVAANSMLVEREQTTVVPVGVTIKNAGEYTFAMPEGTNGVGVTLVDTEANIRTSLSALDYTVSLEAGEYTGRFVLEISPIQNTPTDLGNVQGDNVQGTKARKVMIDGILYIVKDGKMYDARGARVE